MKKNILSLVLVLGLGSQVFAQDYKYSNELLCNTSIRLLHNSLNKAIKATELGFKRQAELNTKLATQYAQDVMLNCDESSKVFNIAKGILKSLGEQK